MECRLLECALWIFCLSFIVRFPVSGSIPRQTRNMHMYVFCLLNYCEGRANNCYCRIVDQQKLLLEFIEMIIDHNSFVKLKQFKSMFNS